jgi:hypothetical protein
LASINDEHSVLREPMREGLASPISRAISMVGIDSYCGL